MNDILKVIADNKRREISALYPKDDPDSLNIDKSCLPPLYSMKESIVNTPGGIIAEFKRRSPSKGDISPMADVSKIIPEYVKSGASACSVLTDTRFFCGANTDLAVARTLADKTPLLRKDFIISKIQIHEARKLGASAILLIAAILSKEEMREFNEYAHSLGLEALVEIHDIKELDKIDFKPDMLGVNNRNLSSFQTSVSHSFEIISSLPKDCVLVAESGIKNPDDLKRLRESGFNGFLIGEAFMSTKNPGETLKSFIDESK